MPRRMVYAINATLWAAEGLPRHHAITPSRFFTHQLVPATSLHRMFHASSSFAAEEDAADFERRCELMRKYELLGLKKGATKNDIKWAFETRLADGIDDFARRPGAAQGGTWVETALDIVPSSTRQNFWPDCDEDVAHEAAVYALDSYMRLAFCPGQIHERMNADDDIADDDINDIVCMDVQLLMEKGWGSEQMSQLRDTSPHECILLEIYAALGVDYLTHEKSGFVCGDYRPEEFARSMRDFKHFVTERRAARK